MNDERNAVSKLVPEGEAIVPAFAHSASWGTKRDEVLRCCNPMQIEHWRRMLFDLSAEAVKAEAAARAIQTFGGYSRESVAIAVASVDEKINFPVHRIAGRPAVLISSSDAAALVSAARAALGGAE